LRLRRDQVGEGHGALTPAGSTAMFTAARTEGLVSEPTYTGKALGGLAAAGRTLTCAGEGNTLALRVIGPEPEDRR
jgi:hypothetical protein